MLEALVQPNPPTCNFTLGPSVCSILSISHSMAAGSPLSECCLTAVMGYIAQLRFNSPTPNCSLRFYRFIVAISRLFARIRTTACCISG